MRILGLDSETTTKRDASPYSLGNEDGLVCWSWAENKESGAKVWKGPEELQQLIDAVDLIVMFNGKFDLGWLRKHGVDFSNATIWDVQIAEFIISRQLTKFPSLRDTCVRYGIAPKLDVVKEEYWSKGIDTCDVPWPILSEYAAHDAAITLACYHEQLKHMTPAQIKLCKLMCQDMLILQEMEANGITYDAELCAQKEKELSAEIEKLNSELHGFCPDVPLNFGSNHQLSAFLYGGVVVETVKEHVGFYKTGSKAGQPKYKNKDIEHVLPRRYTPLPGTEMQAEGVYKTSEDVLRKLKGPKGPIEKLLRLSKVEKLLTTYYKGLPALNEKMGWPTGKLHGQFNQTLAVSGRLSSSKPNQQNFASELQDIFISELQ